MRITQDHLRFWQKKAPTPQWWHEEISRFSRSTTPLIHSLINQQVPTTKDKKFEAGNLMAILRLRYKRNQTVVPLLLDILNAPPMPGRSPRRVAYARKWLNRINKEHKP